MTALLAIDPQFDFCDPDGALYVPGADQDMERAARWLTTHLREVDAVIVTLDSHHLLDIAHPGWWLDEAGNSPAPFTVITSAHLREGKYRPRRIDDIGHATYYVEELERRGQKALVIWPPHCLLGHPGHAVYAPLRDAIDEWELTTGKSAEFILKGLNPRTEHYSAIRAEIELPGDPQTQTNHTLLARLRAFDRIVVIGEAMSHCVADTVTDISHAADPAKIELLLNAMSPVPSFEPLAEKFLQNLTAKGAKATTID